MLNEIKANWKSNSTGFINVNFIIVEHRAGETRMVDTRTQGPEAKEYMLAKF